MPASSSVRSKKALGRSASFLARVHGRSEAGLSGARPCFWAARRATWLCAGVEREAAASAVRLPVRGEPRAPPQAICVSQIGDGGRAERGLDRTNRRRSRHGVDNYVVEIRFISHGTGRQHRLSAVLLSGRLKVAAGQTRMRERRRNCSNGNFAALATKMG